MVLSDNEKELKVNAHKVVTRILATDWFDWRDIKVTKKKGKKD